MSLIDCIMVIIYHLWVGQLHKFDHFNITFTLKICITFYLKHYNFFIKLDLDHCIKFEKIISTIITDLLH